MVCAGLCTPECWPGTSLLTLLGRLGQRDNREVRIQLVPGLNRILGWRDCATIN